MILKLLIPMLTLVVALTQVGLEYVWHDKRKKAHMLVRGLLIIFLIFLTGITMWNVYRDDQENALLVNRVSDNLKVSQAIQESLRSVPRTFSESEITALVRQLKEYRGSKVKLKRTIGDLEIADFADQFKDIFSRSGWVIQEYSTEAGLRRGVVLYGNGPGPGLFAAQLFSEFFKRKEISFDLIREQSFPDDTVGVDIGVK